MIAADERRGVPSASGMERLVQCPASWQMESTHGVDSESEAAASGTRIHAVLAGLAEYATLTQAEFETCDMCEQQNDSIHAEWIIPENTPIELFEERLGLTQLGTVLDVTEDCQADFRFTGQADVIYVDKDRALVIDYKTGRGDTPVAQENAQLAALAVLVAGRFRVKSVRVAIVQPWAGKPTICDYGPDALVLAKSWLASALEAAENASESDLKAGDWCKWCKAAHTCPALQRSALQELEAVEPMTIAGLDAKLQRSAMFARAIYLTPERHIAAYRGLAMVGRYVDAIEQSFKSRVESGEIPGWAIETKPGNREITDAQKAFAALAPLGVTEADMLAAGSVSIGPLEEAIRKASGIKKEGKRPIYNMTGAEAKSALNVALEAAGAHARKADKTSVIEQLPSQEYAITE